MQTPGTETVARWGIFERAFEATGRYDNPLEDVSLEVTFTAPSGEERRVAGFWDGGGVWRVRFRPDEVGKWTFVTTSSDTADAGLHAQRGAFSCAALSASTRFELHGAVRLSDDRRRLVHSDGTPFFWMADTAWNGPLCSTIDEWEAYIQTRVRQRFTAVQWVTTQFVASPDGDREHELAFEGRERISINPTFFQRLDAKLDLLNHAGLLGIPVLLWAALWSSDDVNATNPGHTLPEDQAILLARYMVARWGAHHVVWILNGDGDYTGANAERWRRIGRAVFGPGTAGEPHAPVSMHPSGMQWSIDEYRDESWLDIIGYQSGHGDSDETLRWLFAGPPATDWQTPPPRPIINLEPPYENHVAYHSKRPHSPLSVRRTLYWSLLNAPTAGVTYGGHGVWGWDDGSGPPTNHPGTGTPVPWREALTMPAAEQVAYLVDLFTSIPWWLLRPATDLLVLQPGEESAARHIAAASSDAGDLAVLYVPQDRVVEVRRVALHGDFVVQWFNPRTGERVPVEPAFAGGDSTEAARFITPGEEDWLLLLRAS